MAKSKKQLELEPKVEELVKDLQRTRADFENFSKRAEQDKKVARQNGEISVIMKFLPIFDNIKRSIDYLPEDFADNSWAQGVSKLAKDLDNRLSSIGLEKIEIIINQTEFDPNLHEAVSMEEGTGENEIIIEELQSGWKLHGLIVRHAMVRVVSR